MDGCAGMSLMPWMQSTSIRHYKQMSRERGKQNVLLFYVYHLLMFLFDKRCYHDTVQYTW